MVVCCLIAGASPSPPFNCLSSGPHYLPWGHPTSTQLLLAFWAVSPLTAAHTCVATETNAGPPATPHPVAPPPRLTLWSPRPASPCGPPSPSQVSDLSTFSAARGLEWLNLDNCDCSTYASDIVRMWPAMSWLEVRGGDLKCRGGSACCQLNSLSCLPATAPLSSMWDSRLLLLPACYCLAVTVSFRLVSLSPFGPWLSDKGHIIVPACRCLPATACLSPMHGQGSRPTRPDVRSTASLYSASLTLPLSLPAACYCQPVFDLPHSSSRLLLAYTSSLTPCPMPRAPCPSCLLSALHPCPPP